MTARRGIAPANKTIEPAFSPQVQIALKGIFSEEEIAWGCTEIMPLPRSMDIPAIVLEVTKRLDRKNAEAATIVCQAAEATARTMTPTGPQERAEWHERALQGRSDVEARQMSRHARLERERLARHDEAIVKLQEAAIPTQRRAMALCCRFAQETSKMPDLLYK